LFFTVFGLAQSRPEVHGVLEETLWAIVDEAPGAHFQVAKIARLPVLATKGRVAEYALEHVVHVDVVDLIEHLATHVLLARTLDLIVSCYQLN
jgi:hypothetical protein